MFVFRQLETCEPISEQLFHSFVTRTMNAIYTPRGNHHGGIGGEFNQPTIIIDSDRMRTGFHIGGFSSPISK